ncbi:Kef-type potassium/proton antiporter (CPA2 family) [Thermosporothrix hazakensis]|uniref:Kef-type potassium/proton antiporter (CPA2 family) n=2 Tax=Thermosporothrix TaxID=768650 RepID=A0A326UBJ9_THEHA|nr:cation:proton antiporter [Thermosporothrix hazakensis]PZW34402.1 Kef-type potassium/proton antiporter (CPA2 family) [Thermosporothrix hazakensis]
MIHDLPLLLNIVMALIVALIGAHIARLLKLPTMVGYLLGGVAIGPFTPGYVGDLSMIQQLAELGIIFLMFGVGLHFSLSDLWAVRRIAIPGALLQIGILTLVVVGISPLMGWSTQAGILIGLALSIASTVVMLRNMMDEGLLNTPHGKVAVGWLVLEDLITVLVLVLLPTMTSRSTEPLWQTVGLAMVKALVFAAIMLVAGTRLIPWLLNKLALVQSRELFIVAIVVLTIGTALAASQFFGVSLALGAFLAGVVVSESSLSYQVEAEISPFRELFTVVFFVSVGMQVNPLHLLNSLGGVLLITALILLGKFLITLVLTAILARSAKTSLVLAAGRSQIGEFSFLLGSMGVSLGVLTQEHYSLLLAGAMISIMVNPFLFRLMPWLERQLQRVPFLWSLLEGKQRVPELEPELLKEHVVVIGYGRVGEHIVRVLGYLRLPRLVVDMDLRVVQALEQHGVPALYGDAASSEILKHAHVERARAVVVTVPDEISAQLIVQAVRERAAEVPIVVRAATQGGIQDLFARGASAVIHPELEGGLNITRQTLLYLGCQRDDIQTYTDAIRQDRYDLSLSTPAEKQALEQLKADAHQALEDEPTSVQNS